MHTHKTVSNQKLIFRSNLMNPKFVKLHASRGHESDQHKFFMRLTGKYKNKINDPV